MARSFPYIEAALKEALRVFPTAPTLVRETSRAVSLGGYSLAKGQVVAVSVYSMHHNQAYWDVRLPWLCQQTCTNCNGWAAGSKKNMLTPHRTPRDICQSAS